MNVINLILIKVRQFFNVTLDIYVYILLVCLFFLTAYPFWYILVYSVSDPLKITSGFLALPRGFNFQGYKVVFDNPNILNAFFISVARSVLGPAISLVVSFMAAYSLSRRELPGNKFFAWYFVVTMYFGAGLIPYYLLIKSLGLIGTFWVYIIPGSMSVFGMILMRTYIESLPEDLHDSAFIDGANEFIIFYKIIMPLCKPVLASIGLLACVNHWNSYTDTLLYNTQNIRLHTLQYILVQIISGFTSASANMDINELIAKSENIAITPMSVRMAITIVTIVPISLVYPMLQRYFIKGIMIGAIKG